MKFRTLLVVLALVVFASIGKADIATWYCADDGDGVITCPRENVSWLDLGQGEYEMGFDGVHNDWDYGHMVGWFDLGADGDPAIKVINSIDNDTGWDWTDYHVNISMSIPFDILTGAFNGPKVTLPNDWPTNLINVVQPTLVGSQYVGSVDYYAGTPVPDGQTLEFSYKISFVGEPLGHYTYVQEMIPTPEPGTFVLVACGLLGLFVMRRRFA
jgi:hypothetical protein